MYIIIVITRRRHSMQRSHLLLRALFTPIVHMFIVLFPFMFYVRPKRSYFAAFLQVVSRKGGDGQSALVERLTMPPPPLSLQSIRLSIDRSAHHLVSLFRPQLTK